MSLLLRWKQKQSFCQASSPGSGARRAVPCSLLGTCVQAGAETVTSQRYSVAWPGLRARCDSRFISRAIFQDLGLCSAQKFSATHEAVDQTPPFPPDQFLDYQVPHSNFSLFLLPFKTEGNKDIVTSLGLCFSPRSGLGVLQPSRGDHCAPTATADYSIWEDQCRSSQCALQIFCHFRKSF